MYLPTIDTAAHGICAAEVRRKLWHERQKARRRNERESSFSTQTRRHNGTIEARPVFA